MNSIGIDLGTTNSVACTIQHGHFEYLKFSGKDLLPSAILYTKGKMTVGAAAKRKAILNADNFISSAKTYMGDHKQTWSIDDKIFTPTDVAAEVLKEIFKSARKFFNNDDEIQAVITVPAQFSFDQIAETKKAGKIAGFNVKQVLAEPIAAAIAYSFENTKPKEKIYVVDLGGGTFDVALLESRGKNFYQTLMKDGDRTLGGDDFDKAVANLIMRELRKTIGVDLSTKEKSGLNANEYSKTLQKLYNEAEKIKCALSNSETEPVDIINFFPYQNGLYDLHMTITRDEFLAEAAPYVRKIENVIRRSFEDTNFSEEDVDRVILVGGSANMPFVRNCVKKFFDKEPYSNMDLSKLVAMGAAIMADDELSNGIEKHDIISHSFGIEVLDNRMEKMLQQNDEYPCENTEIFYTVKDYQDSVEIRAYEGENTEDVSQNRYIGGFVLKDIERAPAGKEIEIRFSFDESCILHVMAKDPKRPNVYMEIDLDPTFEQQRSDDEKVKPYDIVLLLDNSGSMWNSLDTAKDACQKLISEMIDTSIHRVAFATFETNVHLHSHLTNNQQQLINAINSVEVGGSTNMTDAFEIAYQEISRRKAEPLVIIVTDGMPDNSSTTTNKAEQLKRDGVKISAIGAGKVDHQYLASLASSPQDYYQIIDMNGLADAFKNIVNGLRL
ncbi:MAG: Hsp70 family protein [Selenomonadaceae bacterium]|nr:Hsp70 family protein [Selenomonadaceae bacterium]